MKWKSYRPGKGYFFVISANSLISVLISFLSFVQWELICDRRHLKALIHTGYLTGMLVGSLLVSRISDNFGRKVAIFMSLGFQVGVSSRSSTSHFSFFTSRNSTNSPPLFSTVNYFGGESIHWLLFDSATFLCPQGGRCGVVQLYIHQMVGEREIVNGTEEIQMY